MKGTITFLKRYDKLNVRDKIEHISHKERNKLGYNITKI